MKRVKRRFQPDRRRSALLGFNPPFEGFGV